MSLSELDTMLEKALNTTRADSQGNAPRRLDPERLKATIVARQACVEIERLTASLGEALAEKSAALSAKTAALAEKTAALAEKSEAMARAGVLEKTVLRLTAESARKDALIEDLTRRVRTLERERGRQANTLPPWSPLTPGCGRGYGLA